MHINRKARVIFSLWMKDFWLTLKLLPYCEQVTHPLAYMLWSSFHMQQHSLFGNKTLWTGGDLILAGYQVPPQCPLTLCTQKDTGRRYKWENNWLCNSQKQWTDAAVSIPIFVLRNFRAFCGHGPGALGECLGTLIRNVRVPAAFRQEQSAGYQKCVGMGKL